MKKLKLNVKRNVFFNLKEIYEGKAGRIREKKLLLVNNVESIRNL